MRSTPATAMTVLRYLFQSWVRASLGEKFVWGFPIPEAFKFTFTGGAWIGILSCRWLLALAGVRRSHSRRCESLETAVMTPSVCGLHCAE